MKSRTTRFVALCMAMALMCGALTYRLVQLQLVQGSQPTVSLSTTIVHKYDEFASRGELYDRNGTLLVGNALRFSVQLDYYNWDKDIQNQVLLQLQTILQEDGVPCDDHLPLTGEKPLAYTEDEADLRKLEKFLAAREWGSVADLTPERLFGLLCARYDVDTDLPLSQRRIIIGARYYLESYQFSAYNTPVPFSQGLATETVAHISEMANQLPGVTIQVSGSREYHTDAAAHLLGRVALIGPEEYEKLKEEGYGLNDTLGKDGMEQALESYLRGEDGVRAMEVDRHTGQVVSEYMVEETQPGKNCYLTIDLELQKRTEQALAETLASIKERGEHSKNKEGADAEGGAAVVINVRTGEILAMASYPTYSLANYQAELAENNQNPLKPYYNRAVQGTFSPGSTFKMCTALAALEEGIITTKTKIRDLGVYQRYADVGYAPKCWIYRQYGGNHGNINVSDALKYSCNYFFYEMGYQLGIEKLDQYAASLGLGEKTGVELTNESAGNLAGPASRAQTGGATWFPADTLMAAIGQSDHLFSPLQLANYVATLVNGGTRYQPHLLKKVTDYADGQVCEEIEPVVKNTVSISDTTLNAIKTGMKGVVTEDGTASSYFARFPISVGGKTGSAQMVNHSATGVFVSFAPYDDPEIAVCIVGEYVSSGGSLAPVAIEIYDQYFGLGLHDVEEEPEQPSQPQPAAQTPARPETPSQPEAPVQPEPEPDPLPPQEENPVALPDPAPSATDPGPESGGLTAPEPISEPFLPDPPSVLPEGDAGLPGD